MSIPRIAVRRPVAMVMIVIGLIVLGVVSILRMPMALLPDLRYPAAAVIVEYPNVGPWEVEAQVARPIEEVLATVNHVTRISSSSETGVATIVAEFAWGTDMDIATLQMRERLDLVRGLLPEGVQQPQVFKFDPSLNPMFEFNIGGADDMVEMRRLADETIKNRLERLDGVASVTIAGGLEREIRVELDAARLELHQISFDQVRGALAAGNLNLPGGSITDRGFELLIRTVGEYTSIEEIARTVVHVGQNGVVRVEDVATVADTHKPETRLTRLNGAPSVSISVQKESEANTVQVSNVIRAELERLQEELGDQYTLQIVWDEARLIRVAIQSLVENGLVGAVSATLVLLAFLRAIAPTLVVAIAIPVAAVGTFFFLYVLDVSLNMLSLGGLALGMGMLVDNAIVALENIARHRQEGKAPLEAAAIGAEEVGGALTASTLTTMAVFLPVIFVGGLAAEIFRDLSLAVSFSLLLSLVVAVTFVPMMAGRLNLRPARNTEGRVFSKVQSRYATALAWSLRHKGIVIGVTLAAFVGALLLVPQIGMEFLPAMDTGEFSVRVRLPYGTPKEVTDEAAREVEAYLATIPEVETVSVSVVDETARMHVGLVEQSQRRRSTNDVIEAVRVGVRQVTDAEVRVTESDPFGVGGGGGDAPINLMLRGPNLELLQRTADEVVARISAVPGTREVETSFDRGRPELQVLVDRERAARAGLTVGGIASSLRMAVDGVVATKYRVSDDVGREYDVTLQLAEEWRRTPDDLERILIATPFGINVALGDVAAIVEGESPISVHRDTGARVVRVFAHISGRDLNSVMRDIERALDDMVFPADVDFEIGGEDAEMRDAFGRLSFALVLAVGLVYMMLAAQFESYGQPFIIMLSVPMAFIGVVAALLLFNRPLSVPAMVGLIMTAGIVVNNAIVLIDYINQLRRSGLARAEALVQGCKTRLRPVLMTTSTTVLGMLPLFIGYGEGTELQVPIATVVMGGLVVSTLLTLGLIPVLYELVDDAGNWLSARTAALRGRGRGDSEDPAHSIGEL